MLKPMRSWFSTIFLFFMLGFASVGRAVEVAPRISDREIIEALAELKAGQQSLQQQIEDLKQSTQRQIEDLKQSTQQQIEDLKQSTRQQMDDLKQSTRQQIGDLRQSTHQEIAALRQEMRWTLGIYITLSMVVLGAVLRLSWRLGQRQAALEGVRGEVEFLKEAHLRFLDQVKAMAEALRPPKDVL